ncbi:MAG: DNA polymerase III subunit gamma/tau [Candidatus Cloacimonadaceae bacterium]|nr:DNA polymerase III subunit gamma/tau [Candidatus Cloacimonadaceae bacterium]MDP3114759.1 DNA polymerase III subunit gamma/tau [Candidatus Cloacimonadaceae bacterium]
MSYIVLARKYRPQTFAEVYAQEHVTEILHNAINGNRIAHAYLFTGPRGVGKTSMARILAKSLNCIHGPTPEPCNKCHNCVEITSGTSTDVIEIDGASNTGVDDIRELQRELLYAPSQCKYKIYIIDEVHMLSKSAFNALLKTLEEPPENVLFIFATTEPHKVIPTIISRCQRYDFKRIPIDSIVKRLKDLMIEENIEIDSESLYLIARKADGGLRDALSLMDQVLSYCMNKVTIDKVREIFGLVPNQVYNGLLQMVHAKDSAGLVTQLHQIFESGTDLQELITNMMEFLRIVILRKLGLSPTDVNTDEYPLYDEIAGLFMQNNLLYMMSFLMQTKVDLKTSANPYLILEVVMIKLCKMDEMDDIAQLISRFSAMPSATQPVGKPLQMPRPQVKAEEKAVSQAPSIHHGEHEILKLDFNLENLNKYWGKIVNRIRKSSGASSVALKESTIKAVQKGKVVFSVAVLSHYNTLIKNKDEIEKQLSDIFDEPIRIEVELRETEVPARVQINRKTIEDLKALDPNLAKYIEITDSKLGSGS